MTDPKTVLQHIETALSAHSDNTLSEWRKVAEKVESLLREYRLKGKQDFVAQLEIDLADFRHWLRQAGYQVKFGDQLQSENTLERKSLDYALGRLRKSGTSIKRTLEIIIGETKTVNKGRRRLSKKVNLVYKCLLALPEQRALLANELLDWLSVEHNIEIDESTLKTNYLKPLKEYGLENQPKIGYYIPIEKRPKSPS